MDFKFFNPFAGTRETENRLPHWQQQGALYFITFHLADSLPAHLLAQWETERAAWLDRHPKPWTPEAEREYHERFSGAIEQWLDAGHGSCVLRRRDCAEIVAGALRFFDGERVAMLAFVVMPNHVHALFVLRDGWMLEQMLHSWKRHSSVRINRLIGKAGQLWQRSYFDRMIRDQQHLENVIRYIRRNPAKAKLREGEFILWESDCARCW
jgi:REP element-mobilizing transposase RayT